MCRYSPFLKTEFFKAEAMTVNTLPACGIRLSHLQYDPYILPPSLDRGRYSTLTYSIYSALVAIFHAVMSHHSVKYRHSAPPLPPSNFRYEFHALSCLPRQ